MNIIEMILSRSEFKEKPPILLDIGSSGQLQNDWKKIAKFSICIAFDADDREMSYIKSEKSNYKQLYVYNAIVVDKAKENEKFYLTRSPYCSSLLKPNLAKLNNWLYAGLFEIERDVLRRTIALMDVFKELHIDYLDWFKTDSQGIDLRLFKSLDASIRNKIIIADFEPGILDAYFGEDKLHNLLEYMDSQAFFVSEMDVRGAQRMKRSVYEQLSHKKEKKYLLKGLRKSPGWVGISYFNDFSMASLSTKRELMLGIVFAIIKAQYGIALELTNNLLNNYSDDFFYVIKKEIFKCLKYDMFNKKAISLIPPVIHNLCNRMIIKIQHILKGEIKKGIRNG